MLILPPEQRAEGISIRRVSQFAARSEDGGIVMPTLDGATLSQLRPTFGLTGTHRVSSLLRRANRRHHQSAAWRNTAREVEASRGPNTRCDRGACLPQGLPLAQARMTPAQGCPFDSLFNRYPAVNAGSRTISPPRIADWCAQMPVQVQLADCVALGHGSRSSSSARRNSFTRCGCEPPCPAP